MIGCVNRNAERQIVTVPPEVAGPQRSRRLRPELRDKPVHESATVLGLESGHARQIEGTSAARDVYVPG
jgi:hypothetical protein